MSKKNIGIILVAALVALALGFAISNFKPLSSDQGQEITFADVLGRKIRVAIWQVPQEILQDVLLMDSNGDIDKTFNSPDPSEYDIFILFADGWDDTSNFYYADTLGFKNNLISKVRDADPEFDSVSFLAKLLYTGTTTGRTVQIEIYNVQNMADLNQACIPVAIYSRIIDPEPNNLTNNTELFLDCGE